jgi:hypothetical protein
MSGPLCEVFAKLLRGLSGARITKPGHFKNNAGDGVSVRCSYKADDGQVGSSDATLTSPLSDLSPQLYPLSRPATGASLLSF